MTLTEILLWDHLKWKEPKSLNIPRLILQVITNVFLILVPSILSDPEEDYIGAMAQYSQILYLLCSTGLFGTPRPTLKRSMIINYYALDFRIDYSLRVCFAQLPSQSTFSQDSELAVFVQKLKSDSIKL